MSVPKNVLEQEQAAERAIDEAQRRKDAARQDLSQPEQPLSPSVEGKPEAQVTEPIQPAPAADPIAPALPVAEVSLQDQLLRERQLRKTLEGRLKSQLKPANEEIKRLKKSLEETQEVIKTMQTEGQKPGAERFLSDEERDDLGDVLDINTRMVRGILAESLGTDGSVEDLVRAIVNESNAAQSAAENEGPAEDFWPIVDQLCPGSREINQSKDPRWLDFLEKYNPTTGARNRDEAVAAIDSDDPPSLADIFADFMRQNGIVQNAEATQEPARNPSPRPERAGGGRQDAPTKEAATATWTQAEVHAFYTDVSKGKFRGRDAEFEKLEAEIMVAIQSGAIKA